jgi:hypothetical protein
MRSSSHNGSGSVAGVPGNGAPEEPCKASPRAAWSAEEAARYIGDLTGELAEIARHTDLDLLAYLLDVVRLEASRTARRINGKAD